MLYRTAVEFTITCCANMDGFGIKDPYIRSMPICTQDEIIHFIACQNKNESCSQAENSCSLSYSLVRARIH